MRAGDAWDESGRLSPEVERFLRPRQTPELKAAVLVRTRAGLIGAAMGLLFFMLAAAGESSLLAVQILALRITGSGWVAASWMGSTLVVVIGLGTGAVAGALFGVITARLIGEVGALFSLGVGVTYGLLLWIVGQFLVLEYIAPDAFALFDQHVLLLSHVVYGAALGILPFLHHLASNIRTPSRT